MSITRLSSKLCFLLMLSGSVLANTNTDTWPESLQNNLPAFYPELKVKMTYPQSWLSGNYSDFSHWQQETRDQVRQALLAPEATVPFAPEILESQDRGSYIAEKVALNITDESRVNALILKPKSPPPYPAIVLLHDHGSKFDIGKEKMIKPWGNEQQLASAQAWVDKFFTGNLSEMNWLNGAIW